MSSKGVSVKPINEYCKSGNLRIMDDIVKQDPALQIPWVVLPWAHVYQYYVN